MQGVTGNPPIQQQARGRAFAKRTHALQGCASLQRTCWAVTMYGLGPLRFEYWHAHARAMDMPSAMPR